MSLYKWSSAGLFVLYIFLIYFPLSVPVWVPWIILASILILIVSVEKIPFPPVLTGTAATIQLAGGLSSPLFFAYIPVVFLLEERGLEMKIWWMVLPLFSLLGGIKLIPFLIFYPSILFLYLFKDKIKKKDKQKEKKISYGDFEEKVVRKSIEGKNDFPARLSTKFRETLNTILYLIDILFDCFSVLILLKDKKSGEFKVEIAKSEAEIKTDSTIEKGPLSWFLKNRGVLINNEYNDNSENLGYYRKDEFVKCFLACSIEINEEIDGILVVDRKERIPFEERDKEIIKSFSKTFSTLLSMFMYMRASMLEAFRFKSLLNLTERVAGEIKLEEVRRNIFKSLNESYDDVWAMFILKEAGEYHITEQDGRRYTRPIKNSIVSLALKRRISLCKEDLTRESKRPILLPEERDFGAKALLFSPFRGNIEGGILLLSKKENKFDDKSLKVLNLISDIAASSIEKAILYEREREKAIRDGLTGAYNHRFFQEIMENKLAEARRNENPLSLLMLDIDNFKEINDKYGHQTGDIVLKRIGEIIGGRIRSSDVFARYGGEEFAIILPNTPAEKAVKLGEVLRKVVETATFKAEGDEVFKVTISIGIAESLVHSDKKEGIISAADRALYLAKEMGKNETVLAEH